jgi:hypothetical protein
VPSVGLWKVLVEATRTRHCLSYIQTRRDSGPVRATAQSDACQQEHGAPRSPLPALQF